MSTYNYITPDGVIVADTVEVLESVNTDWKELFGDDLDVNPETPQGMLIAADTKVRTEVAANNVNLANQINPNMASGIFLDDICAMSGLTRRIATPTVVHDVSLGGEPNTVIPSGTLRATKYGDEFSLNADVLLDDQGNGKGTFTCTVGGQKPCPVASLVFPAGDTPPNLEWSTNPFEGMLGEEVQSDESLRQERRNTLYLNGKSLPYAISSRLYRINGVRSLTYRENPTHEPLEIDGVTLKPHSIWLCIEGGKDDDIARALYDVKTGGTGYNGDVEVNYHDYTFNTDFPALINRPTLIPIRVRVQTPSVDKLNLIGDIVQDIKDAIMKYVVGHMPQQPGFVVGRTISPYEIAAAVKYYCPTVQVDRVEIALLENNSEWSTDSMFINIWELGSLKPLDIRVYK